MIIRCIVTLLCLGLYGISNFLLTDAATLATGKIAGMQFKDSDAAYVVGHTAIHKLNNLHVPILLLLVALILLWQKQLRASYKALFCLVSIGLLFVPTRSFAYYEKTNWPEPFFILPNESAFFVPDVGANKDSQAKLGSLEYLQENKIPAKRFEIPHTKLSGSGYLNDFWVPSGRLIIVDRTPFMREWAAAHDRGTSTKNQAFPCQSREGLNVLLEMTAAAKVTEENSPVFLFNFGVKPPAGDRTKPEVIFTSVYYSYSLIEVMESLGRGKIQSLLCSEVSKRTLDAVNTEATIMLASVRTDAEQYFATKGITLEYLGYGGTFTFDPDVQRAINDRYTTEKIAPVLPVLQAKALIDAMTKWNGQLPASVSGLWMLPGDIWATITGWFGGR